MPVGVTTVKLDLDGDGVHETDISAFLLRDRAIAGSDIGRSEELDAARSGRITLRMNNADGRFSPKKASSPYFNDLHPQIGILVEVTYNSVTTGWFVGIVEDVNIRPLKPDREAWLTCSDWMSVFARSDTRLPLMFDKTTGVIVNRLIDESELGELVTNPRFKDDLDGYSDLGAATSIRTTAGVLLHPPAAMDTSGAVSSTDGWQYAIPHAADADLQGVTARAVVYVWAEVAADVGKTVRVRLADNLGGGTYQTATLTADPQMVRCPAYTFGATAGDFFVQTVRGITNGAPTWRTGLVHAVPAAASIPRGSDDLNSTIDVGQQRLARVQYHRVKALTAIQEIRDNELGGLFYFNGNGEATYEDRHHRWRETASRVSQATFDESFQGLTYSERAMDRISEIVLDFPRYIDGTPGTVVFKSNRVPILIPANDSITIEVSYGGGLVRDTIVPVASEDYKANASANGEGADETGNVTLDFEDFGGGAQAKFTNIVARPVYLTLFKIRATPVRQPTDRSPARAKPTTAPRLLNVLTHTYRLNADRRAVQSQADYLVDRWGNTQRERVGMTLVSTWTEAALADHATQILTRKVSDRITVINDDDPASAAINAAYYIDSLRRTMEETRLVCTMRLSPADKDYGIWDTSTWGGADEWAP